MDTVDAFSRRISSIVTDDNDGIPKSHRTQYADPVRVTALPPNFAITYMNALRNKYSANASKKQGLGPDHAGASTGNTGNKAGPAASPAVNTVQYYNTTMGPAGVNMGNTGNMAGPAASPAVNMVQYYNTIMGPAGVDMGNTGLAMGPAPPAPVLILSTNNFFEKMKVDGEYVYKKGYVSSSPSTSGLDTLALAPNAFLQSEPMKLMCGDTAGLTLDMTLSFTDFSKRPEPFIELVDSNTSRGWNSFAFYRLDTGLMLRIGNVDLPMLNTDSKVIPWCRIVVRMDSKKGIVDFTVMQDGVTKDRSQGSVMSLNLVNMTAFVRMRVPLQLAQFAVYDTYMPDTVLQPR